MPSPLDGIGLEKALGFVALAWLVGSFLLMARSIRKGQDLADELARRHPRVYDAMGQPRPGYFDGFKRTRFAQFVGRREFIELADPSLSAEFEAYRRNEARLVLSVLATGAILAASGFAMRHAA